MGRGGKKSRVDVAQVEAMKHGQRTFSFMAMERSWNVLEDEVHRTKSQLKVARAHHRERNRTIMVHVC